MEAAKSDSNDSDAWRANVDKVIEKLGEDDIESTDGSILEPKRNRILSGEWLEVSQII